jgi:hypothetical protein
MVWLKLRVVLLWKKKRMDHGGIWVGIYSSMTDLLMKGKFGHRHTHTTRMSCEDEGRYTDELSTSQVMPMMASKPP